jgi:hypothetical protein
MYSSPRAPRCATHSPPQLLDFSIQEDIINASDGNSGGNPGGGSGGGSEIFFLVFRVQKHASVTR